MANLNYKLISYEPEVALLHLLPDLAPDHWVHQPLVHQRPSHEVHVDRHRADPRRLAEALVRVVGDGEGQDHQRLQVVRPLLAELVDVFGQSLVAANVFVCFYL